MPDELTRPAGTGGRHGRRAGAAASLAPAAPAMARRRPSGEAHASRAGPPGCAPRSSRSSSSPPARALGAAGYRLERTYSVQPPAIEETADGWTITGQPGREFSGLALNGPRLIWQDGASIEYVDLGEGTVRLLGPGPGMRTTWDPAIGERYAIWFEAERQASLAAQAVAYDTQTRPPLDGWATSAPSTPTRRSPATSPCGARPAGSARRPSGACASAASEAFEVAAQRGAPVVSGGLVVWAHELDRTVHGRGARQRHDLARDGRT